MRLRVEPDRGSRHGRAGGRSGARVAQRASRRSQLSTETPGQARHSAAIGVSLRQERTARERTLWRRRPSLSGPSVRRDPDLEPTLSRIGLTASAWRYSFDERASFTESRFWVFLP